MRGGSFCNFRLLLEQRSASYFPRLPLVQKINLLVNFLLSFERAVFLETDGERIYYNNTYLAGRTAWKEVSFSHDEKDEKEHKREEHFSYHVVYYGFYYCACCVILSVVFVHQNCLMFCFARRLN